MVPWTVFLRWRCGLFWAGRLGWQVANLPHGRLVAFALFAFEFEGDVGAIDGALGVLAGFAVGGFAADGAEAGGDGAEDGCGLFFTHGKTPELARRVRRPGLGGSCVRGCVGSGAGR